MHNLIDGAKEMSENHSTQRQTFGYVALVLGFLSFASVVGHFFAGPFDPPPPLEFSIAEKAESIRDATIAKLKGEDYAYSSSTRERTLDDYLTYTFIGLAVLAVLMSVIGFIRHEPWRASAAGAALGGLAITFQFIAVLFFAFLFAIVLAAVIDKLDFSF